MNDSKRLCHESVHAVPEDASALSDVPMIDNEDASLNTCLIQDAEQLLELELIHTVPKDPVLDTLFRHLNSQALHKHVAIYLKLNFIKLAAIHAMKESEETNLILALQNLMADNNNCTLYVTDEPAHGQRCAKKRTTF
jgi:hypothetical protein